SRASRDSSRSAGGQLEHPWEVNSSTSTGPPEAAAGAAPTEEASGRRSIRARRTGAKMADRSMACGLMPHGTSVEGRIVFVPLLRVEDLPVPLGIRDLQADV